MSSSLTIHQLPSKNYPMSYKKKKYLRQDLELTSLLQDTLNNNCFFIVFQLKSVNILDWILFQQRLSSNYVKSNIWSVKLLEQKNLSFFKFGSVMNIYTSHTLIIYQKNDSCMTFHTLKDLIFSLESTPFLVFLYVLFDKTLFSARRFHKFVALSSLSQSLVQVLLYLKHCIYLLNFRSSYLVQLIDRLN